jgi:hypothetical protein
MLLASRITTQEDITMKKYAAICVIVLLYAMCAAFAVAEEADNPVYKDWSPFKPGSFVTYKAATDAAGVTTEAEMTYTLKEVTPEKVVLEIKMVTIAAGMKVETPGELMEFPAKGEGDDVMVGDIDMTGMVDVTEVKTDAQTVEEGEEELEINGQKITTQRLKVITEDAGSKVTATLWYSDDIPGRMVKSLTEVAGPVKTTSEMTLIDYKTIK